MKFASAELACARQRRQVKEDDAMKWTELYRKVNGAGSREPNLTEVLSDPIIRAVMRGDGVDPNALARILGIPIRDRSPERPDQPRSIRAISCELAPMRGLRTREPARVRAVRAPVCRREAAALLVTRTMPARRPIRSSD